MPTITADWISDKNTQIIFDLLIKGGFECYFVGGCVRNVLMDVAVNDIDISTNASPKQVIQLADDAGLKSIPTGIEHGTITVMSGNEAYEITTYRRDVETDGRRAVVAFSNDILDDAKRRDFTMNALYADQNGVVVDPLNGLSDLLNRNVRFIENADKRIKEDYLRILRFFRFNALYGKAEINQADLDACGVNANGLDLISKERIGSEIKKLLNADNPVASLKAMKDSGVLEKILPGSTDIYLEDLVKYEVKSGIKPDALKRLAIMDVKNAKQLLCLSNIESKRLDILIEEMKSKNTPGALGYYFGEDIAKDIVSLRYIYSGQAEGINIFQQIKTGAEADFPIKSVDLMPEFQGKALGDKLKELKNKWINSDFNMTKQQLLN